MEQPAIITFADLTATGIDWTYSPHPGVTYRIARTEYDCWSLLEYRPYWRGPTYHGIGAPVSPNHLLPAEPDWPVALKRLNELVRFDASIR